jgi:hypothetical protein
MRCPITGERSYARGAVSRLLGTVAFRACAPRTEFLLLATLTDRLSARRSGERAGKESVLSVTLNRCGNRQVGLTNSGRVWPIGNWPGLRNGKA